MKKEKIVLGIDIGGTNTKIGFVSKNGKVYFENHFSTESKKPFENFISKLTLEIQNLTYKSDNQFELIGIGIGAPNANFYSGQMEYPPNFKWGDFVPIVQRVKQVYNVPIRFTNDANAAAVGQLLYGIGHSMKNFVVLTLGTGLGSGIIINGRLLVGEHGVAGEIGHINVNPNGRMCNCGLQGCLETYASVTGIRRTVFELISEMKEDSSLKNVSFNEMTGETIANAAIDGDKIAEKAFEFTGEILGTKIADVVAVLDPEAIILTGGLVKAGKILLDPIKTHMEKNLFSAYKGKIKILTSKMTSSDAVIGAASMVWNNQQDKFN
ncbi:ROK family protein [Urechidicola croceus]|uniref:Glucokinase n=1 Tax=Urechidicola croceus TaxID=1850246 RepID=A0A1D8P7Y8_9FLAO|nr:ROK family protein [Urechidicola croceus]AOW20690.1 glucokinase [Urechidicola croceus]